VAHHLLGHAVVVGLGVVEVIDPTLMRQRQHVARLPAPHLFAEGDPGAEGQRGKLQAGCAEATVLHGRLLGERGTGNGERKAWHVYCHDDVHGDTPAGPPGCETSPPCPALESACHPIAGIARCHALDARTCLPSPTIRRRRTSVCPYCINLAFIAASRARSPSARCCCWAAAEPCCSARSTVPTSTRTSRSSAACHSRRRSI